MQIFHDFGSVPAQFHNGAVSIGKFDGVHHGHEQIINHLKKFADKLSLPSIVVTFCPHPVTILQPAIGVKPIHTLDRKIEIIGKFDVDAMIVIDTNKMFLQQSAETFFFDTLCGLLHARVIVCGRNFTFGCNRTGTAESIKSYGKSTGLEVDIVEPVQIDGNAISSSLIRKLIQEGRIDEANKFLGMPYRLSGVVGRGDARGVTLGFPTANLEQIETIMPKQGVYATIANVDGKRYLSTTNIGACPTFDQHTPRVEIFLHDFNDNIYDKKLHIDIISAIRDVKKFDSVEQLIVQIKKDIDESNKINSAFLLNKN
ncbi:MAG: bifunctional riboflavin kinase/FAD synthetase [Planctomycetaceae bacterium]|nr:bifunctional riboflavin kinase/FAD synthetase [Planctomycetaceae bacterium]